MNCRFYLLIICLLVLSVENTSGQRLRYKHIYEYVEQGNYVMSDSLLRQYLSDDRNDDHANANYQLGLIEKRLAYSLDVFRDKPRLDSVIDSGIRLLARSKELIDDREIRRNDEYYGDFKKRDLRTGKEEIKLFDVHQAIDQHVTDLNKLRARANQLNSMAGKLTGHYDSLQNAYASFIRQFENPTEMLLSSTLTTVSTLDALKEQYNSFSGTLEAFRSLANDQVQVDHTVRVSRKPISDPFKDGFDATTFTREDISVWNYGDFAESTRKTILEEILPLKSDIVREDRYLDSLLIQVTTNTDITESAVKPLESFVDMEKLEEIDPNPLPKYVYGLKHSWIDYQLQLNSQEDTTAAIGVLKGRVGDLLESVEEIGNSIRQIAALDFEKQVQKYRDYLRDRYMGENGFNNWLMRSSEKKDSLLLSYTLLFDSLSRRDAYMLAGHIRVPIDTGSTGFSSTYEPLFISGEVTTGLVPDTTGLLYISRVNPERVTDSLYRVGLDTLLSKETLDIVTGQNPNSLDQWLLFSRNDALEQSTASGDGTNGASDSEYLWPVQVVRLKNTGVMDCRSLWLPGSPYSIQFTPEGGLIINITMTNDQQSFVELTPALELVR